jgi:hypothetical protein
MIAQQYSKPQRDRRNPLPAMRRVAFMVAAVWGLLSASTIPAAATPKITGVTVKAGGMIDVRGSGFGTPCPKCEIIADYGGFKYALTTKSWRNSTISAHLPDFGKKLVVQLTVQTKTGKSGATRARIKPVLHPERLPKSAIRGTPPKGLSRFTFVSKDRKGGRGEQSHTVRAKPAACGKKTLAFHAAGLVLVEKRFAQARISRAPKSGCLNCQPVKVSWRHEPTGRLSYQLLVQSREIDGICPKQRR